MSQPPAFQLYSDDFLGGTCDMTQGEIGAYILLLCHQWNRGSIPVEPERQQLIAKGSVSAHVIEKFDACPDGLLRNARLEEERRKQDEFREKQRQKGIASGRARQAKVEPQLNNGSIPVATGAEPEGNSPVSNLQSPNNTPVAPKGASDAKSKAVELEQQAAAIYAAYPLKVGKPAALKAIIRQLATVPFETLLELTQRYAASRQGDLSFTPHPATWFNQQRFNDDPITWTRSANSQPTRPGTSRNAGNSNAGVADQYRLD